MNFRLSASLLITALALTGCGNSGGGSSKYDEVELIEYESCLSSESEQWNLALTEGNIQRDLGNIVGAELSFRNAINLDPKSPIAYSNLLFLNSYCHLINQREYLSLAKKWEQSFISEESLKSIRNKIGRF